VARGYGRILAYPYFDESVGTINAGLLVTRATIAKHPDRVQALVTAHARATETLVRDRDRWLGRAADFGTPPEVLEQAATNMELSWRMDDTFFRQLKALGERMQRLGLIDRQPDYDQLVDRRFVDHANEQLR
jgi:NitT/TauT family transport system substrate-binding protein